MTPRSGSEHPEITDPEIEELLVFIRDMRGFDFSGYKRSTLRRRLAKRMYDVGAPDATAYRDRLEADPAEFTALFDTALINVTSFFRDGKCWEYLRTELIPSIVARSDSRDGSIRLWSAGCATGQETYSLAMSLADALGLEEYDRRVKIYGTDIDERALGSARAGVFSAEQVASIPQEWFERYFTQQGNDYSVNRELRHRIVFGRHDLTLDAPISRIDLISCRNTLMYFNTEAQSRIVNRLHFGLRPGGLLFLGRAEMLLAGDQFTAVSVPNRVFSRSTTDSSEENYTHERFAHGIRGPIDKVAALQTGVLRSADEAILVIDGNHAVALANPAARAMFNLADQDLGRPFGHLQLSYRSAPVRAAVDRVAVDGSTELNDVEMAHEDGTERLFRVQVRPLTQGEDHIGAAVTFTDVTKVRQAERELNRYRAELETTQQQLRSANQEQEAANEELQSMNEELETTNEELQSTNEELETTNEELQSTNEELETMNEEARLRRDEADQYNTYLQGVLASMTSAVAVLDGQSRVRYWNRSAEQMLGAALRRSERPVVLRTGFRPTHPGAPRPDRGGNAGRDRIEITRGNRRHEPPGPPGALHRTGHTAAGRRPGRGDRHRPDRAGRPRHPAAVGIVSRMRDDAGALRLLTASSRRRILCIWGR